MKGRLSIIIGAALLTPWLLCALFANWIAPFDPLSSMTPLELPLAHGPGGQLFVLGTDDLGRDILSRLIYGARTVLVWAGLATVIAYLIGIVTGLVAGFYRGWIDRLLSFGGNVVLSFPVLVLYLLLITKLGASALNIVLAVTFANSPAIFRVVRAVSIDLRERDFVLASITQGESAFRVMVADMLPNAAGPLTVDACLRLGYTAITIGVLGFLGLGLSPETPDWGGMVNAGRSMAIGFPHVVVFPCIAISSLMLGLSLLADGLRERKHLPIAPAETGPATP